MFSRETVQKHFLNKHLVSTSYYVLKISWFMALFWIFKTVHRIGLKCFKISKQASKQASTQARKSPSSMVSRWAQYRLTGLYNSHEAQRQG